MFSMACGQTEAPRHEGKANRQAEMNPLDVTRSMMDGLGADDLCGHRLEVLISSPGPPVMPKAGCLRDTCRVAADV
jgi:hypothetical protein